MGKKILCVKQNTCKSSCMVTAGVFLEKKKKKKKTNSHMKFLF